MNHLSQTLLWQLLPKALLFAMAPAAAFAAAEDDEHEVPAASVPSIDEAHDNAPFVAIAPPRPSQCRDVIVGEALQPIIDSAAPGSALCLADGVHAGPFVVRGAITIWGKQGARVLSAGTGTTVRVEGSGSSLLGFTIDGSGGRFDQTDAGLRVTGTLHRVEGLVVERATFGILVELAKGVVLRGNDIRGARGASFGKRGDGIRLWESEGVLVLGNRVRHARDVVVWYSRRNVIADNLVVGCRYGAHFMYSHDNFLQGNRMLANVVGIFVMYSRGIALRDNTIAGSFGASGMGLGLKESGNITAVGNRIIRNTVGVYSDTSPLDAGHHNTYVDNDIQLGGVGISFLGRSARNSLCRNSFRDNLSVVEVQGGGDASAAEWLLNEYSDYAGYDLDSNTVGDVAYEQTRLSSQLTGQYPQLAFFRGTPALLSLDTVQSALPLFPPKVMFRDAFPAMDVARLRTESAANSMGLSASRELDP